MKQVWKCDTCPQTGTQEEIKAHEDAGCSFSPKTRLCWTCKHKIRGGAWITGFWNDCRLDNNCADVEDRAVKCPDWEEAIG